MSDINGVVGWGGVNGWETGMGIAHGGVDLMKTAIGRWMVGSGSCGLCGL